MWHVSAVIEWQHIFVTLLLLKITIIYAVNSFISCDRFGYSRLRTTAWILHYKTVWRNNNMSHFVVIVATPHGHVTRWPYTAATDNIIWYIISIARAEQKHFFTFIISRYPLKRICTHTLSHNHSHRSSESSLCTAKALRPRH